jgi:hypothetical protein
VHNSVDSNNSSHNAVLQNGETPLGEHVGQLVIQHYLRTCQALARPAPNKLYNLLGAGIARAQHLEMSRC